MTRIYSPSFLFVVTTAADDQHRTRRVADHPFGHAPEECPRLRPLRPWEPRITMIGVLVLCDLDERAPRRGMLNHAQLDFGHSLEQLGRLTGQRFSNRILDFGAYVSFEQIRAETKRPVRHVGTSDRRCE